MEASLSGLLILAGVRPGYAVLATLAYRIASYWLPLLAGLPQLLPAWLASFQAAAGHPGGPAPDVVLTAVNSETVIGHVTEGTADLGFRDGRISAAELAAAPLVSREGGSETRDTLAAALAAALGTGYAQAPAALSVSTTAAVRAAVLAGAAPAVISELAVADDWPQAGWPRSGHPSLTCAGPCASSGPARRTRLPARPGTWSRTSPAGRHRGDQWLLFEFSGRTGSASA